MPDQQDPLGILGDKGKGKDPLGILPPVKKKDAGIVTPPVSKDGGVAGISGALLVEDKTKLPQLKEDVITGAEPTGKKVAGIPTVTVDLGQEEPKPQIQDERAKMISKIPGLGMAVSVLPSGEDPLKQLSLSTKAQQAELFKQAKGAKLKDVVELKKKFEDLNEGFDSAKKEMFPTLESAQIQLKLHPDIKINETSRLAQDIVDDSNNVLESLTTTDFTGKKVTLPLVDAAVKYYSKKDDEIGRDLREIINAGKEIPTNYKAQLLGKFLKEDRVRELAKKDKEFGRKVDNESSLYWDRYPELANEYILKKIQDAREATGQNNPILNLPGLKSSDNLVKLMVKTGDLTPQLERIYNKYTRKLIATHAADIETPGLIESAAGTAIKGFKDVAKSAYDYTLLRKLRESVLPEGEVKRRELADVALEREPTKFRGINYWSNLTGNLLGFAAPISVGGGVLSKALALSKESKVAEKIMTGLTFGHDIYENEMRENKNPALAYLSALTQTLLWTKGSDVFSGLTKNMVKSASPGINRVLQSLQNGEITNNQASRAVVQSLLDVVKKTGKGVVVPATEIAAIQSLATAVSNLYNGKFDFDQIAKSGSQTFQDMALGLALPVLLKSGAGARRTITDFHNDILADKENYKASITDPEAKKNFDRLVKIDDVLKNFPNLTKEQREQIRLSQLQEEVLKDKADKTPIPELKTADEAEIKRLSEEKKNIVEGKMPEEPIEKEEVKITQEIPESEKDEAIESKYNALEKQVSNKLDEQLRENKGKLDEPISKGSTQTIHDKIFQDYLDGIAKIKEDRAKEYAERRKIAVKPEEVGVGEVKAEVPPPTEEPSKEQQLKDVQEGNVVTFDYENESQVPDVFKDKISSKGEINGKPYVKVTVAKSLADYELGKKESAGEAKAEVKPTVPSPTKLKLSGKFVDTEKADDVVNKIKELGEPNELNEKQVVINGVKVEVERFGGQVLIKEISAIEPGKGAGTEVLNKIKEIADNNGVEVILTPEKIGVTSKEDLIKWYKKNGFEEYTQGRLIYKPEVAAEAKPTVPTPTEEIPKEELPSEKGGKVIDVNKEIEKRKKSYAEPQAKQAEINKFVSDVEKYNNLPNGRLGKEKPENLKERNRLMGEAQRLGVSFKVHGAKKFIITDAKYVDKTNSNLAIDNNFKPLEERSDKAKSLMKDIDELVSKYGHEIEMVIPNDIVGADGKRMNSGQIRNAINDIKNNIPSKGANLVLDAIEKMAESGTIELRDGQNFVGIPIEEYFDEMKRMGERGREEVEKRAIEEAETMPDEAINVWINEMAKEMKIESEEPYLSKEKQKEYEESITGSAEEKVGEKPEVQPVIGGKETEVDGKVGGEPTAEKLQVKVGKEEPPKPPAEEVPIETQPKPSGIGIKHSETEMIRERYGLPEYEREPTKKDAELEAEADRLISEGYDIESLIKKIEGGTAPTGVENFIIAKYIAALDAQVEKNPSDKALIKENTAKIQRAIQASDKIGSLQSEAFRTRKAIVPKDDSLASRFITEMEILGVDRLTDSQMEKVKQEYELEKSVQEAYDKKIAELEAENAKLKAEAEIKKIAKQKGAKKDYAAERKQIVQSIKDKLKEARKETKATIVPYANELIAIAPDVAKLVKNIVEEGTVKFSEVVKKVYDSLKEDLPDITETDVVNLMAGEYNKKKPTRNQLAADLYSLQQQAKLINKYEKLEAGVEPKSEKKARERNKELNDLRQKIKEHDLTKLADYKKRTQSQIEKIQNDIKTGNFSKEIKKEPLKLDKEALDLKDKLIKAKTERQVRILREQYENRGKFEKSKDWLLDKLNVPRSIMSSMDYSAPFRQALVGFIARPRLGIKALPEMFKASFSQKNFDRYMYDMRENPRFEIAKESGLAITDPDSPFFKAKEEAFMSGSAEKIPGVGKMIKGSERAYVMFLNKLRFDSFNRVIDAYESQGKTMENSPELYKATANLINAETGRGDLGALKNSAPVLNALFFSPRLIASRFNLLTNWANPYWYRNTPKEVRIMYMKDMLKFIGAGMTILALAKASGAEVDDDPTSSDFGKIKVGKTRWDIWGGFQQYVTLVGKMAVGKKGATTKFIRSKLAPVPAITADFITGKKATGEDVTVKGELLSYGMPLIIGDVADAVKDKGISALFTVGVPAAFGVGVQTYGEREPKIPKKINFEGYDVDLNSKQYDLFQKEAKDRIKKFMDKAKSAPGFNDLSKDQQNELNNIAKREGIKYAEYVVAKNPEFRKDLIEKAKIKMKEKEEKEKTKYGLEKMLK